MNLPTFQGPRLRQAREIRQMTAAALAERIDASAGAVSQWESGMVQPRPAARQALASALDLPEAFFLRPLSATAPTVFRFRKLSAATKRAREAVQGQVQWLHEIVGFLDEEVSLPALEIPVLDLPRDPQAITDEDIEKAAMATRQAWGLRDGPIPDMVKLIEAHGVIVARFALNAAGMDGLSAWSGAEAARAYMVLNSEKASCARGRFDAAHELGHLVLHRHAPARPESALYKLMEGQAHRFAGAFVFPSSAVRDEVAASPDLDGLVPIKARWKLSIGAIIFRLAQLGLISTLRKETLQRQIGARGWRSGEPLDDKIEHEQPTLVQRAYGLLAEKAGWTSDDIIRAMPISGGDHARLASLRPTWMDDLTRLPAEIVTLKPRATEAAATGGQGGKILPFNPRS